MKVLVIDLLRLGDCLMITPVLNGIRASKPEAEIDMLTFKPVKQLHPMLPFVRNWWTLDRDELQAGLGEAEIPMLTAYSVLQEQLDTINAQEYDLIINLTQNQFSAWVAGYLKSSDRLGLTFDSKGLPHFYSAWFRYLNDQPENAEDIFHYTDIFAHACGLDRGPRDWTLKLPKGSAFEVDQLGLSEKPIAVMQLFTSDIKKNWSIEQWLDFSARLSHSDDLELVALGAPHEEEQVDAFIRQAAVKGVRVSKAILSLGGALELLQRAKLLITGDTSIKHLANATDVKVIELCLGWSDYRRTGIYKADSLILKAADDNIPSEYVASQAHALLNGQWEQIERMAQLATDIKVLRTRHLAMGFWFAEPLVKESAAVMKTLVERGAWKLILSRGRTRDSFVFGTAGVSLREDLKTIFNHATILTELDFLESTVSAKAQAASLKLVELKRQMPAGGTGRIIEIATHRGQQIGLDTHYEYLEYKTKLIRTLKSNWTEMI